MKEKAMTNNRSAAGSFFMKYWLLILTIAIAVCFGIPQPMFFRVDNLLNILSSACLTGIAGIGVTCVMATGEMDFSAGTSLTMGALIMAKVVSTGFIRNYYLAILFTLACLIAFGLLNAFLHIKVGMPSCIATMGSSYLVKGILKGLTNGSSIYGVAGGNCNKLFTFLGQGYLFGVIPMPLVVLIIISIIMMFYTERTRSGKYLYAVGSNPTASRFIGIDDRKQKLKGFVLCAVLCGIAGILQGSMVNGASPTLGDSMMLNAITVLMLGATFLKIGVYNVPGTIVGAVLLAIISNALTMWGVQSYVNDFVQAAILFAAVSTVAILRRRISKS